MMHELRGNRRFRFSAGVIIEPAEPTRYSVTLVISCGACRDHGEQRVKQHVMFIAEEDKLEPVRLLCGHVFGYRINAAGWSVRKLTDDELPHLDREIIHAREAEDA